MSSDEQKAKTEEYGGDASAQNRPDAVWQMTDEIGDGHLARCDEGSHLGKQANHD